MTLENLKLFSRDLRQGNIAALKKYRVAQVMYATSNDYWEKPAMQVILLGWILTEIVSFYVLLKLRTQLPFTILNFFVHAATNGFMVIQLLFSYLCAPYVESCGLIRDATSCKYRVSKCSRKFGKSCSPLKLIISDGHFFDKSTAIVIWQFCVDQLIVLICIK